MNEQDKKFLKVHITVLGLAKGVQTLYRSGENNQQKKNYLLFCLLILLTKKKIIINKYEQRKKEIDKYM